MDDSGAELPEEPLSGSSTVCPDCGAVLSARLDGLCPVCLMGEEDGPEPPDDTALDPVVSGPGLMPLPGYRLTREIARGGMGIIYEAVQASPSRTVAIKMLLPHLMEEPAMRERFRREAQAMAGLDHRGILPVFEVGDYAGLPYFSMKLAAGGTLSSQAWRFRQQWRRIASLIADLADAIQIAHSHGVLHRDLKPGNILFDEQDRAYLSDFGIAKQLSANSLDFDLTQSATLLGTPNYLPPEWAAGTARSPTTAGDLYGLGAIFYQLLTGDPPHRAAQLTTLLRQIADDPVMPPREIDPGIPKDLEIIALKALAKEPAHRYASAHELAEDLRLWLAGRPIQARPASALEKIWRWSRRNPLTASLAALLVTSLTVGGTFLWSALQTSRQNLHQALISEASALRETGRLGNRTRAITALEQAIQLRPSRESQYELTSALAMTDLREIRRLPYGSGRRVRTDPALTRYVSLSAAGQVSVRSLRDNSTLSQLPAEIVDPDSFGPFSPDGRYLCLRPRRDQAFFIWDCDTHTFFPKSFSGRFPLFSPDGHTLAVGQENGELTLFHLPDGTVAARHSLGLERLRPYSFSPDGQKIILGQSSNSRFAVLDLTTGRVIKQGTHPESARLRCAVWRPDQSGFYIGTESFKIYEWTFTENSLPRQYVEHQGNILAMAIHPDGEWLVSQSEDGTTLLWNTASATSVAQLPFTGADVRFSADGRQLLCENRANKTLHFLELVPSAICRQIAIPHPDPDLVGSRGCWNVAFSPDGALLSAADTDGLFHFHGHTGQLLHHEPLGFCWSLAWTPDRSALYSVSASGMHRRTAKPQLTQEQSAPPAPAPSAGTLTLSADPGSALDPDPAPEGKIPSPGQNPDQPAGLTNLQPPPPTNFPGSPGAPTLPAWQLGPADLVFGYPAPVAGRTNHLNHMALSSHSPVIGLALDDFLQIFQPNGQPDFQLPTPDAPLDALALNPNGTLAAASMKNIPGVALWDLEKKTLLRLLPTSAREATLRFHPDGQHLLTGDSRTLTYWHATSGKPIWSLPALTTTSTVGHTALSADGNLLAVNLAPDLVSLLNATTGREITRLRHPNPHVITGLAFSPDQSRLAVLCAGHLIQLWNLAQLRTELQHRTLDWPHPPLPKSTPAPNWTFTQ